MSAALCLGTFGITPGAVAVITVSKGTLEPVVLGLVVGGLPQTEIMGTPDQVGAQRLFLGITTPVVHPVMVALAVLAPLLRPAAALQIRAFCSLVVRALVAFMALAVVALAEVGMGSVVRQPKVAAAAAVPEHITPATPAVLGRADRVAPPEAVREVLATLLVAVAVAALLLLRVLLAVAVAVAGLLVLIVLAPESAL